jgi:hypothetical protein
MRVYLPSTMAGLRLLVESGEVGPAPITGFAVTPGLRARYLDEDLEELEYAAMLLAARASLRLIDADPFAKHRRVVISADVSSTELTVHDDLDDGVVRVLHPVLMSMVAAVHIDDADAEAAVAAAAEAIVRADIDGGSAQDTVDDAEGYELSWYATQEIGALVELS